MTQRTPGLDAAYAIETPDDNRRLYADWAATYEADFVTGMDYRLPFEVARAYAQLAATGPVLDIGAGTGAVGRHLSALGIGPIDGTDISPEMLAEAGKLGIYRALFAGDVTAQLPVQGGTYAGVISAGTFTLGHVGPGGIDEILRITAPGATVCLSINARHWQSAGFAAKFDTIQADIADLSLAEVPIYGPGAKGDHATDTALITTFRRL